MSDHLQPSPAPQCLYTEQSLPVPQSPECRICLQPESLSLKLIAPCRCTGSVQYTHQQCLIQWLECARERNRQRKGDSICCELCRDQIMYCVEQGRECKPWGVVRSRIRQNLRIFIFLLFLFAVNCGVTVYLLSLFARILRTGGQEPKFIEIGVIGFSIVLLVVISTLLLGILVREFIYTSARRISAVLTRPQRKKDDSLCVMLNAGKGRVYPVNITDIEELG